MGGGGGWFAPFAEAVVGAVGVGEAVLAEDVDRSGLVVGGGEDRGVGAFSGRDAAPSGGDGCDEAGPADVFAQVGVEFHGEAALEGPFREQG